MAPTIAELRAQGVTALGPLAAALNDREVTTPRGGRWHKTSVRNLLARLG
ncbi:MAG TPA: recombinase-like helix-turn-helix domain-containing protein [Usitatibacter sp.]|nr:recombinase-like helix-turn-helix domain-containing protein [Usitatibacter sp.]